MIRDVILAAVVVLGTSYDADDLHSGPYTLWVWWPESAAPERVPSTNKGACEAMAQDVLAGWFSSPPPRSQVERARKAECRPGDGFKPGWDCIQGFNCRIRRHR